jgi:predicted ATPase
MNIKELKIKGYKSIGEITLHSPNPFSVFVGANGAGKSNIFEALEFFNFCDVIDFEESIRFFGTRNDIYNRNISPESRKIEFKFDLGEILPFLEIIGSEAFGSYDYSDFGKYRNSDSTTKEIEPFENAINSKDYKHLTNFTRLFIGKSSLLKRITRDDLKIALDGSNLEKVLKRIFEVESTKNEIVEILQLLIPEFVEIQVVTEEFSGTDNLLFYEQSLRAPITKRLISDGTYNILAILAAIYQSDKPQFLCIEEPENGLNPKVVMELVNIIRTQCAEKGHYIWLNTHSQTLVSELRPEEIILVDKVNGMTQVKQVTDIDLHGLRMDEALLTNSLGGGIPW